MALWTLCRLQYGTEVGIFGMLLVSMATSFWVDNGTATIVMMEIVNETFYIIERHTYTRMGDSSLREFNTTTSGDGRYASSRRRHVGTDKIMTVVYSGVTLNISLAVRHSRSSGTLVPLDLHLNAVIFYFLKWYDALHNKTKWGKRGDNYK